jgi:hypothetical protein
MTTADIFINVNIVFKLEGSKKGFHLTCMYLSLILATCSAKLYPPRSHYPKIIYMLV